MSLRLAHPYPSVVSTQDIFLREVSIAARDYHAVEARLAFPDHQGLPQPQNPQRDIKGIRAARMAREALGEIIDGMGDKSANNLRFQHRLLSATGTTRDSKELVLRHFIRKFLAGDLQESILAARNIINIIPSWSHGRYFVALIAADPDLMAAYLPDDGTKSHFENSLTSDDRTFIDWLKSAFTQSPESHHETLLLALVYNLIESAPLEEIKSNLENVTTCSKMSSALTQNPNRGFLATLSYWLGATQYINVYEYTQLKFRLATIPSGKPNISMMQYLEFDHFKLKLQNTTFPQHICDILKEMERLDFRGFEMEHLLNDCILRKPGIISTHDQYTRTYALKMLINIADSPGDTASRLFMQLYHCNDEPSTYVPIQLACLTHLKDIKDPKQIEFLREQALHNVRPPIATAAAEALANYDIKPAAALIDVSASPHENISLIACKALGQALETNQDPRIIEALKHLAIHDSRTDVAVEAYKALAWHNLDANLVLLEMLQNPNPAAQIKACNFIGQINITGAVDQLFNLAFNTPHLEVALAALTNLQKYSDLPVASILTALRHPEAAVRIAACSLARSATPPESPQLIEILKDLAVSDPVFGVSEAACNALKNFRNAPVSTWIEILNSPEIYIQKYACRVLGEMNSPEAAASLKNLALELPYSALAREAYSALAKHHPQMQMQVAIAMQIALRLKTRTVAQKQRIRHWFRSSEGSAAVRALLSTPAAFEAVVVLNDNSLIGATDFMNWAYTLTDRNHIARIAKSLPTLDGKNYDDSLIPYNDVRSYSFSYKVTDYLEFALKHRLAKKDERHLKTKLKNIQSARLAIIGIEKS